MLEQIEIDVANRCRTARQTNSGPPEPIGDAYCFEWGAVAEAARKAGQNLDRYLTFRIASHFARKRPRSSVLIFYTPVQGLIVMTVCAKRKLAMIDALHSMPGYLEYGQEFVPRNARPFTLYDGQRLCRTYLTPGRPTESHYICDFGNLFGMSVDAVDEPGYEMVLARANSEVEYSVVPMEPTEEVQTDGATITLHHVFCR